jgi:DNA end-binding protein Ku
VPRAIWNGSISFGLVTIPVKLYNAVSRKSVRFNQLDDRTGSRIKYAKISAADGSEVSQNNIVRGYEYTKGQYILVSDEEIQSVAPKAGRSVDIEAFVGLEEIDPMWFDGSYYVAPAEGFEKAYRLLVEAMSEEGRVALARFVRSNKQYLAAIRPNHNHLQLATMVYADEIVPATDIPEFEGLDEVELTEGEMAMARQLIGSLATQFDPQHYRDTHREELVALLERKAAGEEIVTAVPEVDDGKVVDLLAALEASVAAAKAGRSDRDVPTKKKPAKKATAQKRKSA